MPSSKLISLPKWMIIKSVFPPWWMMLLQYAVLLLINASMIILWMEYGTGAAQKPWQSTPWFARWLRFLGCLTATWRPIPTLLLEHLDPTTLLLTALHLKQWCQMVVQVCALPLSRQLNSAFSLLCKHIKNVHVGLIYQYPSKSYLRKLHIKTEAYHIA